MNGWARQRGASARSILCAPVKPRCGAHQRVTSAVAFRGWIERGPWDILCGTVKELRRPCRQDEMSRRGCGLVGLWVGFLGRGRVLVEQKDHAAPGVVQERPMWICASGCRGWLQSSPLAFNAHHRPGETDRGHKIGRRGGEGDGAWGRPRRRAWWGEDEGQRAGAGYRPCARIWRQMSITGKCSAPVKAQKKGAGVRLMMANRGGARLTLLIQDRAVERDG
ncbi:hypothetical protein CC85DRAFT_10786 [Cutaneotrichosporon oleaginosum]|uniref:Uncharacterized protein n=1 Tax=Cutaneotrichosporon oleaginosum TaxID=879819 RepID=A0A0J0XCY3_9TREE|nr:uncharacterized protein CC85DRAFT_10786 [Cutaneotrichosporon oleaginosum]KLT38913.1 hypothetical protein CC85DRAFT_10786 [Cutaneotrichosporon oleaginosum]TXT14723.1 hypothetical protein COLE_00916 [Cutaneotrichosporon oleaginosum]